MVKQKSSEIYNHWSHGCSEHLLIFNDLEMNPRYGAGGRRGLNSGDKAQFPHNNKKNWIRHPITKPDPWRAIPMFTGWTT